MNIETRLREELAALDDQGLARRRRRLDSPCSPQARVEGREMLAFASNDYLGLAAHPEIARALADGALTWGAGSGASHLVSGHLRPHDILEERLAAFTGFARVLTFSTGYLANLAVTPTLAPGRDDAIFADRLNHASLIDAVQLSRARHHRYPHNDMAALERLLAASDARTKVIVSDAVFSMDGDLAPLAELLALAERFDAWLVLDDAHGFGVLGPHGEGSLAHYRIPPHPRVILMGTLGKAAGVGGAFVAGSELVMDYLLQKARSYIFTTAQPPAVACALVKSLELIAAGDDRRAHLQALIRQLQEGLAGLPWALLPSETAIQPLIVGDNEAALALSQALWERGLWVAAIRPPTVPAGTARLRISLSAAHSEADVARLVDTLKGLA
ncbi:8-amino-7-oxononanoate synthase [Azovibrio restrictus]|uniref:8-amino-7-oxononanoate synthase n=1 Tax=Azovibrio restrictus TaxID=146938 RepID=UPI0026EE4DDD|nr:8-amino-7-oxononanoate synthase [Azovibrio restrictus]